MADPEPSSVAKACSTCAKSKAKCDWPAANTRCHRCTRLNKECVPQDSIRKRKAPKIRRAAQIAQLEEKVNSLLSVVGTVHQPAAQHTSSGPSSHTPSASTPSDHNGSSTTQNSTHLPSQPVISGMPLGLPSLSTIDFGLNDPGTLVKDPDAMLSIFQERMASQVPFVVIPQDMTARSLLSEKPFLYMAVMMVASFEDTATQLALGKKGLEHMAERLILRGEKSMDLLQGLLVYLSWYHYFLPINHQLNNLLALISSLFVDLGLKRVSAENEVNEAFIQITRRTQGHALQPKQLTIDEKRALLGCYYLSSCLTSSFSRMDSLRFTPYVEECSEFIASARVHKTDVNLSCLMRLQSLVEKQRLSGLWESLDAHQSDLCRAPIPMLVRTCQIELESFKNSLSNDQLFNPSFAMNYYSAEIHLFEVCFKLSPTTRVDYSMESLRLPDIVHCCFKATRTFFEFLLSVPASSYCTLTIVNIGQMFHALGALYKLSVFDIVDWDVGKVRRTLDLSSVLSQISACGEAAGNSYGPTETDSPWFFCSRKLRTLQSWWNAKLAQEVDLNAVSGMAQDAPFDDLQAMINLDFLDDSFWK